MIGKHTTLGLALAAGLCAAATGANAQPWQELGPKPISDSGGYSGRVSAIGCSATDPDLYYIGGADGGVWKTTDGGTTWTPLTDHMPTTAIGAIAVDPTNDQIVYAGTGEANYANHSRYGLGVLKTTDGGATWAQLAENTFGELRLRSLVRQKGFDRARATRIHSGWDGDRYAVWTKPGEADVLVWASAWDSEKDELDFAAAAVESVLADPAGETGTWSRQGGRRDWQRQAFGLASGLRIGDERGVYLVHQAPAQLREALLNALETGTKWSEIHSTAKDR